MLGRGMAQGEVGLPLLCHLGGQRRRWDENADMECLAAERAAALAGRPGDPVHGHIHGGRS